MNIDMIKPKIEAMLFSLGKTIDVNTFKSILGVSEKDVVKAIDALIEEYSKDSKGIEIIKINDGYQMCTKKEHHKEICELFENRSKPNLSEAALEVLSIIAYNSKITRSEIESIRGVNSDSALNKLLEYELVEDVGRLDAPGRPTIYSTTDEFLRLFGYSSLEDLPELPKNKLEDDKETEATTEDKENDNEKIEESQEISDDDLKQE